MKRRIKILVHAGQQLNRLLLKNNPKLARELEIPAFLELLEKHHKQYLYKEQSDFDVQVSKILNSPSNIQKKLAIIKRDLAFRASKFDPPADELRVAKLSGNTASWFEVKKDRKKRKSKKEEPKVISRQTMFFADNMTALAATADTGDPETPVTEMDKTGETQQEEAPQNKETPVVSRTKPQAADLQKYRREVEAFRREYAGTHALMVEGLSEEYFPVLKQTMTPGMWKYFETQNTRLVKAGKKPTAAAAEAYIKTLSAEKENGDQISVEEMEAIRKFIKSQKE